MYSPIMIKRLALLGTSLLQANSKVEEVLEQYMQAWAEDNITYEWIYGGIFDGK